MGNALQLLSEPECAALYSLQTLDALRSVHVGDRMMVCDAGGGTVDIITYDVTRMSPLQLLECTVGTGDYCGSSFIDREFEELFKRRLGVHVDDFSPIDLQQAVKNFEHTKVAFRDEVDQQLFRVAVPTMGTLDDAGIYRGYFELTRQEMCSLFDPVVGRLLNLLVEQIKAVNPPVNSILLVGGFGGSEYLYRCVEKWAASFGIEVLQPKESGTAVVRGAVLKGLERASLSKTEVTRRTRRWYGVTSNQRYDEKKHLWEDRIYNVETGQVLAQNQISWFIQKVVCSSDILMALLKISIGSTHDGHLSHM